MSVELAPIMSAKRHNAATRTIPAMTRSFLLPSVSTGGMATPGCRWVVEGAVSAPAGSARVACGGGTAGGEAAGAGGPRGWVGRRAPGGGAQAPRAYGGVGEGAPA